jgi:hypothetical protein
MMRSCVVFVSLALVVCTATAVGHLYYGLSRVDAGLLTLCGLAVAAIHAVTMPWRTPATPAQQAPEPQAPSTAVLAYRLADVERRLMALEVQVRAASLDSTSSNPEQQEPPLRARARAELAIVAASLENKRRGTD